MVDKNTLSILLRTHAYLPFVRFRGGAQKKKVAIGLVPTPLRARATSLSAETFRVRTVVLRFVIQASTHPKIRKSAKVRSDAIFPVKTSLESTFSGFLGTECA